MNHLVVSLLWRLKQHSWSFTGNLVRWQSRNQPEPLMFQQESWEMVDQAMLLSFKSGRDLANLVELPKKLTLSRVFESFSFYYPSRKIYGHEFILCHCKSYFEVEWP